MQLSPVQQFINNTPNAQTYVQYEQIYMLEVYHDLGTKRIHIVGKSFNITHPLIAQYPLNVNRELLMSDVLDLGMFLGLGIEFNLGENNV